MHSRHGDDRGLTLVELLITMSLVAIVMMAITSVSITVMRNERPTMQRVGESKDISFLHANLSTDLSEATERDTNPAAQPGTTRLPGTNVLSLTLADGVVVSYRYVQDGEQWRIERHEISGAGTPKETVTMTGAAQDVAGPPSSWKPGDAPTHAVTVNTRTASVSAGIGMDLTVAFPSGRSFTAGGTGPAPLTALPDDYTGATSLATSPRSRCGGTLTLVLDTSLSVPMQSGGLALESAATSFIDAFVGTPTTLSVLGFDRRAYVMYPTSGFANYISLLNPSAEITAAKNRITALDDRDGTGLVQSDPNDDGIHWNQTKWTYDKRTVWGGTNWEDALWMPFRAADGTLHSQSPDLVVFITDGDPNRNRSQLEGYNDEDVRGASSPDGIDPEDVSLALDAANVGTDTGARIIGIMVGNSAKNPASVARLQQVVGPTLWTGTSVTDLGNAAVADVFIPPGGSFANLGPTLRAIMASQCGGTVTVQKRIETSPGVLEESTRPFTFSSGAAVLTLDPDRESAVTFDYPFTNGASTTQVTIAESPEQGFVFDRAVCTKNGQPLANGVQLPVSGGAPGVRLKIDADDAISCIFVSRRR